MIKYCLVPIILLAIVNPAEGHTIGNHQAQSYGQTYLAVFFIAKLLPFIGLGILAKYPAMRIGLSGTVILLLAALLMGATLGFFLHDSFHVHSINYLITAGLGFLMIFYGSAKPNALLIIVMLLICLPLGFEFGDAASHPNALRYYMLAALLVGVLVFLGFSRIFSTFSRQYHWLQQSAGVILALFGAFLLLIF